MDGDGILNYHDTDSDNDGKLDEDEANDIDKDGDQDVLSASMHDDIIAWYENLGGDCNSNGIGDDLDIGNGTSQDCNSNGIPDECDLVNDPSFDCDQNNLIDTCEIAANAGLDLNSNGVLDACECLVQSYCTTSPNSVGAGAVIGSSGVPSVSVNAFSLNIVQGPPGQSGLFYYGLLQTNVPFGDGVSCVATPHYRLNPQGAIDGSGSYSDLLDFGAAPLVSGPGKVLAGSTWNFQFWYRDPAGPGGNGFNLSDGLQVTFCP